MVGGALPGAAANRQVCPTISEMTFGNHSNMRSSLSALVTLLCLPILGFAAEPPSKEAIRAEKEAIRTEERMKEEKKRDEQLAREYANRVKVARFDSEWRSPRTEDIEVVQVGEKIVKSSKAIALLTFECEVQEETHAVAGFIAKAKDLAADAVIMKSFDPQDEVAAPGTRRVFRANAVVYKAAG